MPRSDMASDPSFKLLTPAEGMVVSVIAGVVLWSGLLAGIYAAGVF